MLLDSKDPRIAYLDDYKKYTNKPPQMEGKIINHLGLRYKDFLEPLADIIKNLFDKAEAENAEVSDEEGNKVMITQWYEGKPIRIQVTYDSPVLHKIADFFTNEYPGHVLGEMTITRNCVTQIESASRDQSIKRTPQDTYWPSELWHIDQFGPYAFKIGTYLSDVDLDSGPYEYIADPEKYFFKKFNPVIYTTRFRELSYPPSVVVTGEKFTSFIFHPSVIHKGNYARTRSRDAIMIGFDYSKANCIVT